jgi:predicted glycogen debranching enzyme
MICFGKEVCEDLDAALGKEWLETNGIGGFASSTIVGLNTRRYHGLLVAATKPPLGRLLLLSKLEETLFVDGRSFELSANRYPGVVHPQGFRYLTQFQLDPFPVFTYEVEGIEVEKRVLMVDGENSTIVQYKLKSKKSPEACKDLWLDIRPLIAFRDYHATTHQNDALDSAVAQGCGVASVAPYPGLPSLHVSHNAAELHVSGDWYRNLEYSVEQERGLDFSEDLFNPFVLRFDLNSCPLPSIIASTERRDVGQVSRYIEAEILRRRNASESVSVGDRLTRTLAAAADQFIVSRGDQKTVIAGYHWFGDWGRDTMIALPGLALLTGKHHIARSILRTFARAVDQGMLPNRFPDAGEKPEYNTVDATLWFFESACQYFRYTGDLQFLRTELYDVLADIISWHLKGTRYGIKVDETGLLSSGDQDLQLTWMDAKVNEWVVTPRRGKPVEIQALWYNALCIMKKLAGQLGDEADEWSYGKMAADARSSFNRLFWNESAKCLFDVVDGELRDGSIRPNQILAVSLAHSMLSSEHAKAVVEKVQEHLFTAYGLRTLAPNDPRYQGRYKGSRLERDGAYHQGTVWPWLMGPFIKAYVKINGGTEAARMEAGEWLEALTGHLADGGLGQISEIFDGDAPHRPGGCIAQAWSVAEILRAYVEDIRGIMPSARNGGIDL